MKSSKRILTLGTTFVVSASMLAGCGANKAVETADTAKTEQASPETKKETPVTTAEKVELTVACYSDPFETETVEKQVAMFMEKNPHVNVTVEPITGDFWQVLQTRIASNTEPDVFYMDSYQSPNFINAGALEPLDEYIKTNGTDIDDFEPSLLNIFKSAEGGIYGIPKDYSTLTLFYNKAMLANAGVQPPKTWEELENAAKALTKDKVVGLSLQNELARYQPFLFAAGGGTMKDNKPVVNTVQNAEGLSFWTSLLKNGYASTPQNLGVGWDGDAFSQEIAAMTVEGNWMIAYLKEVAPDLDYGIIPIPTKVGGPQVSMSFTCAYSMSKNSKHKTEAFSLLEYLTSQDAQKMVAEAGRAIPSRISMGKILSDNFPVFTPFVEVAKYASPFVYGKASATVVEQMNKAADTVYINGDTSPEAVKKILDEAQQEIDKALSK